MVLGSLILGRQTALASVPSLTGAMLATVVIQTAANEVGAQDISVFVAVILCIQLLGGLPVASVCMKKYIKSVRDNGVLEKTMATRQLTGKKQEETERKRLPSIPAAYHSDFLVLAQMAGLLYIAYVVGTVLADVTHNFIGASLCYILVGIIAADVGLIKKNPLDEAKSLGICNLALYSVILSSFSGVPLEVFLSQIIPAFIALALAVVGVIIFGFISGKILRFSPWLAICIGCCMFLGYPPSQVVTDEVISVAEVTEEERATLRDMILPKMIVGYLASAIVSLALAGYLATVIF